MSYEGRVEHICKNGHHWSHDCYEECNGYWGETENGVDFIEQDETCPICKAEIVWTNQIDDTNGEGEPEQLEVIGHEEIACRFCKGTGKETVQIFKIPEKKNE